ncbi:hypothetical protein AK812_SmicGene3970 [Symbiodinium microadriaticum]|uniref:EF-hand domain-containing protein n=1 Tax=Symbiodinium microadriaticum TaxID=2951 RepID=A0A1Q9EXI5_SYMMI|nr:hypothetical protein AK812_SmicGene3970 [Symbiodinium microadriaticum]
MAALADAEADLPQVMEKAQPAEGSGSYAMLPTGDQDSPTHKAASMAESRIRAGSVLDSQRQDRPFRLTSIASGLEEDEKPWGWDMLNEDVTILASFMLYICAVILVRAYGRSTPEDDPYHDFFISHFGSIPMTMFALFELITAPDLAPYREAMFANPPLVVFLVVFIILGSFGINGLLVALINESILEKNQARIEADRMDRETKRKTMQQRCGELFDEMDMNRNRVLPRDEIKQCTEQIAELLESYGVNFQRADLDQMFYVMDYSDTGIIERSEFIQGVVGLCDQIRPMSIMELHYQVSKTCGKVDHIELKVDGLAKTVEGYELKIDNVESSLKRLTNHMPKSTSAASQGSNSRRTSRDLDTIQSVTFHQDMIPEWEGEGDAHDIWSTRERADTAEIASQSERSRETKARSPSSDCAGCNVAQDDVAANLAEAHKDEGQELHGMLAKHGKLLTEALEAVQAFPQSAATKSPGKDLAVNGEERHVSAAR